jgi:hypothetical protein
MDASFEDHLPLSMSSVSGFSDSFAPNKLSGMLEIPFKERDATFSSILDTPTKPHTSKK